MAGKKWTQERRDAHRDKMIKLVSDDTDDTMKAFRDYLCSPRSDETKAKMRAAKLGTKQSPEHRANRLASLRKTLDERKKK